MKKINKAVGNKEGAVLVLSLLVMMALTIFTLVATNKTTQGMRYSGDYKDRTERLFLSDGGTHYAYSLIERTIANGLKIDSADLYNSNVIVNTTDTNGNTFSDLEEEIMTLTVASSDSYSDTTPNIQLTIESELVKLDVDFSRSKKIAGTSSEFASRYEGIGSGSAGGVGLYYIIDGSSQTVSGKTSSVRVTYRCVEGGGRCL